MYRLKMHLSELDLSQRLVNRLEDSGFITVEDVLNKKPKQILSIRQIGPRGLDEIYVALAKIGFKRK